MSERYENYAKFARTVAKIRGFLFRNRILLLSITAAALVVTGAYVGTKGIIIEDTAAAAGFNYEYGQDINVEAKAFLSGARYEFSPADKDEWTFAAPKNVGKYKMRAVGESSFGEYYGETHYFEIAPKKATISIVDKEIPYGANPSFAADGLLSGHRLGEVKWEYSDLFTLTPEVNVGAVTILDAAGADVTPNYDIAFPQGEDKAVEIQRRYLDITLEKETLVYNGAEQTFSGKYSLKGALLEGDLLEYDPVKATKVGTYSHHGFSVKDGNGNDKTLFYDIDVPGYDNLYIIEKLKASATSPSYTKTYDGKGFSLEDRGIVEARDTSNIGRDLLVKVPDTFTYEFVGDLSDDYAPGEYENEFTYELANSENYDFAKNVGTLKINKRNLSIYVAKDWTYHGNAFAEDVFSSSNILKDDCYSLVDGTSLADGDVLHVRCDGEVFGEKTYTYEILHGGVDVSNTCYNVTMVGGIATSKADLTLRGETNEYVYDGQPHGLECTELGLQGSDKVELDSSFTGMAIVDVGAISALPSATSITNAASEDRSMYYSVSASEAKTTITQRPLKIRAHPTYEYKGEPIDYVLNEAQYDLLEGTSLVDGEVLTVVGSKEALFDKTYSMPFSATVTRKKSGEPDVDVTDNYAITIVSEATTILHELSLVGQVEEAVYDGNYHSLSFNRLGEFAEDDYTYSFNAQSILEPGEIYATPSLAYASNKATGESTTSYYNVTSSEASVTINPRPLTITCHPKRTYAGRVLDQINDFGVNVLNADEYSIATGEGIGLVAGDFVQIETTKNIFALGESEEPSYVCRVYHSDGSYANNCYDINVVSDGYEANKAGCSIELQFGATGTNTYTKYYDDSTTTPYGVINDFNGYGAYISLPSGAFSNFSQNVGVYEAEIKTSDCFIYDMYGYQANDFYEIENETATATLTIEPRPITLHFYGVAEDPEVTIDDGSLVYGQSFDYTYVDLGDSYTYDVRIYASGAKDVTANYDVTVVLETLADDALTLTAKDVSYHYNGTAQWGEVSVTGLRYGDEIQYKKGYRPEDFNWTYAGSGTYAPQIDKIVNSAGRDVTSTYSITINEGTYEILPARVSMVLSGNRTYNGTLFSETPLQLYSEYTYYVYGDDGYGGEEVKGYCGLFNTDSLTVTPDDSTIFVDGVDPKFNLSFKGYRSGKFVDFSDCYSVSDADFDASGFTFTKADLYVHGSDEVFHYDGKDHSPSTPETGDEYGNDGLLGNDKITSTTYDPANPSVNSSEDPNGGHVDYSISGVTITNGNSDRTKYYNITYSGGSIEVDNALVINLGTYYGIYSGGQYAVDGYLKGSSLVNPVDNLPAGYTFDKKNLRFQGTVGEYGYNAFTKDHIDISSVRILDKDGNDASGDFTIGGVTGGVYLHKAIVELYVSAIDKTYDGTGLKATISSYFFLESGMSITWGMSYAQVTVTFTASELYYKVGTYYVDVNDENFDVVLSVLLGGLGDSRYEVDKSLFTIQGASFYGTISTRYLALKTDSIEDWTGYSVDFGKMYVTGGSLATGDTLYATAPAKRVFDAPTSFANDDSLGWKYIIRNKKGEDVTFCYDVQMFWGTVVIQEEDW